MIVTRNRLKEQRMQTIRLFSCEVGFRWQKRKPTLVGDVVFFAPDAALDVRNEVSRHGLPERMEHSQKLCCGFHSIVL